ncbi:hypothetical protein JZ751_027271 [Albula glossodonta]|uniref:Uncharacterized protein n=1 Tax=Albula glossodonta TaxID=121402 RepID=A0A8T2MPS3_9TELE|nr:hypothetical protein JZ751_027271 [Albula glossodonta]
MQRAERSPFQSRDPQVYLHKDLKRYRLLFVPSTTARLAGEKAVDEGKGKTIGPGPTEPGCVDSVRSSAGVRPRFPGSQQGLLLLHRHWNRLCAGCLSLLLSLWRLTEASACAELQRSLSKLQLMFKSQRPFGSMGSPTHFHSLLTQH